VRDQDPELERKTAAALTIQRIYRLHRMKAHFATIRNTLAVNQAETFVPLKPSRMHYKI
jgi:hypothetical protein